MQVVLPQAVPARHRDLPKRRDSYVDIRFPYLDEFSADYSFPVDLRETRPLAERDGWEIHRHFRHDRPLYRSAWHPSAERIVEGLRAAAPRLPAGVPLDMVGPLRSGLSAEAWLEAAGAQGEAYVARMGEIFRTEPTLDKATCRQIRSWLNEIELFSGALEGWEVRAPDENARALPPIKPRRRLPRTVRRILRILSH